MGVVVRNAYGKLQSALVALVSLIPAAGTQPCFWRVTTEGEQRLFQSEKMGDLSWFQMRVGGGWLLHAKQPRSPKSTDFFSLARHPSCSFTQGYVCLLHAISTCITFAEQLQEFQGTMV